MFGSSYPFLGWANLWIFVSLFFITGSCSLGQQSANCSQKDKSAASPHFMTTANPFLAKVCENHACCVEDKNNTLQCSWTCELSAILYDVLQRVKWSTVVFVFDYSNVQYQQAIVETLSTLYVGAVHVPIGRDREGGGVNLTHLLTIFTTSPFIKSSTPSMRRNVIICVTPSLLEAVLEQARSLHLLTAEYQWFILCPGHYPLTPLAGTLHQDSNVLLLLWTPPRQQEPGTLCSGELGDKDSNKSSSSGHIPANTRFPPCNGTLSLFTFVSKPEQQFNNIDSWQIGHGWVQPLPDRLYANVFQDFGNRLLTIGTIVAAPFVNSRKKGNETVYEGFCIDLLRTMAAHLNFRYRIVESPDNKYGAPEGNGSWNGMVGMVAREEVDMGVGPYTITSIRETVVDFSVPYMEDGGGILTRKGGSATSLLAGLGTFNKAVWLSLLATTLCVGVGLYLVVRLSPRGGSSDTGFHTCGHQLQHEQEEVQLNSERRSSDQWHLWACLLHICGSLMQQGMEAHPQNTSARCLLGFWWVFSILIISTYTATLASMLTVDVPGFRIDSIDDLLASSFKPLVLTGSVWDTLFLTATEGVYHEVAQRMTDMPVVTSEEVALSNVMSGDTAFLHDVNAVQYMYTVNCKKLHLASNIFNNNGYGIIMQQNAPYKDAVNDLILRLQEGGFLDKWRSVWWPVTNECEKHATSVSQAEQLGVPKLTGLLLVYGTVIATSTLSFLLSLCFYNTSLIRKLLRACRSLLSARRKEQNRERSRGELS